MSEATSKAVETAATMNASVRFWRAIRPYLPERRVCDELWLRLRNEPRVARKRHMTWAVELNEGEEGCVREVMENPPNSYVAFCVQHHYKDDLAGSKGAICLP